MRVEEEPIRPRSPAERQLARDMESLADEFATARPLFVALGDETRQLMLLELLRNYGGLRVGELAEAVGLSRPAASHHLRILKDAHLVGVYRVGTRNYYHVEPNLQVWRLLARLSADAEQAVRVCVEPSATY